MGGIEKDAGVLRHRSWRRMMVQKIIYDEPRTFVRRNDREPTLPTSVQVYGIIPAHLLQFRLFTGQLISRWVEKTLLVEGWGCDDQAPSHIIASNYYPAAKAGWPYA